MIALQTNGRSTAIYKTQALRVLTFRYIDFFGFEAVLMILALWNQVVSYVSPTSAQLTGILTPILHSHASFHC